MRFVLAPLIPQPLRHTTKDTIVGDHGFNLSLFHREDHICLRWSQSGRNTCFKEQITQEMTDSWLSRSWYDEAYGDCLIANIQSTGNAG